MYVLGNGFETIDLVVADQPGLASVTWKVQVQADTGGVTPYADTTNVGSLIVEDMGPYSTPP